MKNFLYIFCALIFIISLTGCGKEDAAQKTADTKINKGKLTTRARAGENKVYEQFSNVELFPDIQKIITRGTLNIGIYQDCSVPFLTKDSDGKITGGLDMEITGFLANHLGVKPVYDYNIKSRNELFRKLHTGEIDIAAGELSHTFDRGKYVYFSNTYVQLQQSLIMNKKDVVELGIRYNPYKYLSENTCKIGVQAESAYIEYAQNLFPKADVYEYPSLQDAMDALTRNEIIAILHDDNETVLLARKHSEIALNYTVYVLTNKKDNISIAISPKSPNLCDTVNLYLESDDLLFDVNDLIERYPDAYKCE
ncbi:MAG TPA: hypothetical protein DD381_08060 [Lentisphaeria bacterium]|nr:MAG: hypothetical protein A2X47_04625 [Lentisphaerae bacterium GWF2_38_69]HBM16276.1 hypothetical protein [Lentisphaeria bacterium]